MAAIEKRNMLLGMTTSRILMKRAVGNFFGRLSLLSLRSPLVFLCHWLCQCWYTLIWHQLQNARHFLVCEVPLNLL